MFDHELGVEFGGGLGVIEILDDLEASIDALNGSDMGDIDPAELGELVQRLNRLGYRLDGATLAATRRFDSSGAWRLVGARSVKAWIRTHLRAPDGLVGRQVSRARALPDMELVAQALSSGEISAQHLDWFIKACSPERAELFERDQALLLAHAKDLSFAHFSKAIRYWITLANELLGLDEPDPRESRTATSVPSGDDMWRVEADLDTLDGVEFDNELRRLQQVEFDKDWTEARERLGNVTAADLVRSPAQRLADALVEMARRSATSAKPGEPAARVINLRMDYPTFIAELAEMGGAPKPAPHPERCSETQSGVVLAPSRVLEPSVAISVRRIVFGPEGNVLDHGRKHRLYTGALREAIIERDQQCSHPYCETHGQYCQVDHIQEFEDNGRTNEANGALLCGYHNRLKHRQKRAGPNAA